MREEGEPYSPHQIYYGLRYMPWQQNKDLIRSGKMPVFREGHFVELDRTEFPIAFEIGRAATKEPRLFLALLKAAASIIVEEVQVVMQGKLEQTHIFVKAMSAEKIESFQKIGFKIFERACLGPSNCVLVMPLVDLLKVFPAGSNSVRAQNIAKFLPGADPEYGLDIARRANVYFRSELDFLVPSLGLLQSDPIIIHDFSRNYRALFSFVAQMARMEDRNKISEFVDYVESIKSNIISTQYRDEIPIKPFVDFLNKSNAIRLTNLDPRLARDPRYVPAVLMALDGFLYRRYLDFHVRDPETLLDDLKINYAIQTASFELAHILRGSLLHEHSSYIDPKTGRIVYNFMINRNGMKAYREANPELAAELMEDGLNQGFWFFRAISANPIKF